MPVAHPGLRLDQIAASLGGEVRGDAARRVTQVATLEAAGPEQIAFLANPKYRGLLETTRAGAVILAPKAAERYARECIVTPDPYAYYAQVAQLLNPEQARPGGIHPSATVDSALPESVSVGPGACVGVEVIVGEGAVIGARCVIGDRVRIGAGTRLHPNVTIYPDCRIGARVVIHSGAVIGSDGFGFARRRDGSWIKIPQIGRVLVGDDVEIGANTTIDRGALDDTVIENDVKLDNQIQIAHNCRIGEHSAIAGCAGIAGSTRIGKRCLIGGAAMITGHITIADDVVVSGATFVPRSITQPGVYTGAVPNMKHEEWLRNFSHLRHLQSLADRIRALEARLEEGEPDS
jgi:UDP-3-O-[3-hydroxymyristoyl] glucosamine N-acyltransferase